MLTITEIAPIFAKLDRDQGGEEPASVEKALRNLTQRFPVAPTAKSGRAFVYDAPAIVALRLSFLAHQFGLNRLLLHPYARFLNVASAEAVRRVDDGEGFTFFVVARPIGNDVWASWEEPADDAPQTRAEKAIWLMRRDAIELGCFTQKSALVQQILSALPKDRS